jgi:hypothetical protein
MCLAQFADVPVHRLVSLLCGGILPFDLNRAEQDNTVDEFGNDEIEPFIPVREVDVPASVCQTASNVKFGKIVGYFQFGFVLSIRIFGAGEPGNRLESQAHGFPCIPIAYFCSNHLISFSR